MSDYNLGHLQPAWVGIVPGLSYLSRYTSKHNRQILIICDSLSSLATCNLGILDTQDLSNIAGCLRSALMAATKEPLNGWHLVRKQPTTQDYVDGATKPSYLNFIQTSLYRISNYPLRKEVQALVIKYLNSDIQLKVLMNKLQSSYKLAELQDLLKNDKAVNLRNAVAAYKASQRLELTAKEFKTETFEILYVVNSASKTLKDSK